jgi:hypothetical protein
MQSEEPVEQPLPPECAQQPPPEAGGSGQGAASAYARMQSQLELKAGRRPAEPEAEPDAILP